MCFVSKINENFCEFWKKRLIKIVFFLSNANELSNAKEFCNALRITVLKRNECGKCRNTRLWHRQYIR